MKKIFLVMLCIAPLVFAESLTSFHLGQQLLAEQNSELAAIEFRRFALESTTPNEQAQAYLYAAYAYIQSDSLDDAENMLRHAEKRSPDNPMLSLLYAETAFRRGSDQAALYFLDLLPEIDREMAAFKARRSAEIYLRAGQHEKARSKLQTSPADETDALSALNTYKSIPRKSPFVGGVLGMVPGAGYCYSGETANGFRSLLLNSLFMFGMYHTAQGDQWGAFAFISFFEITWYSGSIYGGVDAAHRYNRNQLNRCVDHFNVPDIEPDRDVTIPLFQLRVVF